VNKPSQAAGKTTPNLVSVTTIAADGSRRFLHPADSKGPFLLWRRIASMLLVAVYVLLPWIPVNGYPAVFLDVANRRFHLMGLTFVTQDLWVGFFVITGLAFSLFYISSLFGRIWCGWTCPYTVFLEHIYRRIERLIDGDAPARRKLEDAPWTGQKITKRVLKHGLYIVVSAIIAHVFLAYFVSIKELYRWMHAAPANHFFAFGVVAFLTVCLYGSFSWFREQFCIIMCPYGRLQSALTDDDTVVIGYDKKRGEPRGKVSDPNAGACISCNRCVQVCPTGIDIRNGLQLECIGCAACVDACDEIMTKVNRPKGLIRYDSLNGLNGKRTRYVRPRTILYTILLVIGAVVFSFALSTLKPMRALAKRMSGSPYFIAEGIVRNQFSLHVMNERHEKMSYRVELLGDVPPGLQLVGANVPFEVGALEEIEKMLIVSMPNKDFKTAFHFKINVKEDRPNGANVIREVDFLGPDNRLQNNDYLNPDQYLKK
jgi:cytochrome c oxidase accessory protein FixG